MSNGKRFPIHQDISDCILRRVDMTILSASRLIRSDLVGYGTIVVRNLYSDIFLSIVRVSIEIISQAHFPTISAPTTWSVSRLAMMRTYPAVSVSVRDLSFTEKSIRSITIVSSPYLSLASSTVSHVRANSTSRS